MNTFIMSKYYQITKCKKDVSNFTPLHKAFKSVCTDFQVTVQNVADQRRAIVKTNYVPKKILEQIKFQLELSIDSNNLNKSSLPKTLRTESISNISNVHCDKNVTNISINIQRAEMVPTIFNNTTNVIYMYKKVPILLTILILEIRLKTSNHGQNEGCCNEMASVFPNRKKNKARVKKI